jgi:hypothetical protein
MEMTHSVVPFLRRLILIENNKVNAAVAAFKTPERLNRLTYPKSLLPFNLMVSRIKKTPLLN